MKWKILILLIPFVITSLFSFAQEKVEMADTMRSNGRIYVVVAVALTILIGLILYIVRLDRKIGKLEKEKLNNRQQAIGKRSWPADTL